MAELMVELFEARGLHVQWQQVEDGRANALGTWSGAGGGPSLMFNGHMDTSYSGREPWLRDVPGFQPQAVRRGRPPLRPRDLEHEGRARLLRRGGLGSPGRRRAPARRRAVAAVCGEIEKTQYGEAQGAQYRGYAAGTRYLVSHGGVADMCLLGEPTEGKVVLGHFGALWLRIRVHGNFIHTAFSEGKRGQNAILRHARGARGRAGVDPHVGGRSGERLPRREGDRQRRRDRGRLRLARVAHAAPRRSLPRRARAADEADGGRAARGARHGARPRGAVPRLRRSRARST